MALDFNRKQVFKKKMFYLKQKAFKQKPQWRKQLMNPMKKANALKKKKAPPSKLAFLRLHSTDGS